MSDPIPPEQPEERPTIANWREIAAEYRSIAGEPEHFDEAERHHFEQVDERRDALLAEDEHPEVTQ